MPAGISRAGSERSDERRVGIERTGRPGRQSTVTSASDRDCAAPAPCERVRESRHLLICADAQACRILLYFNHGQTIAVPRDGARARQQGQHENSAWRLYTKSWMKLSDRMRARLTMPWKYACGYFARRIG